MIHQETFFKYATYFPWQASRLASRRMGKLITEHYWLVLFLLLIPVMLSRISENPRAVIWSDAEGYYQYLPALFIIKDVHQLPAGSVWPYYNDRGEYVNKYTCGIAYFEWPFFMGAYFISDLFGYTPSDYFNPVYCYAMAVCGLLFAFLGLYFLRKSLLNIVRPGIAFLVLCSVFFGTNLFHYATKEMSVSHVYSFFLFAVFIWLLPFFLKKPGFRNSLLTGFVLGWIILIRPTNVIISALILLWDVYTWPGFKTRLLLLTSNLRSVGLVVLGVVVPIFPQLWYWKEMTGHWLYYSYTNEGFPYWSQPKIAAVLFDVQNGLFLYSPLVLLMVVGIFLLFRKKQFQAPSALFLFALATYLFSSWWAWWFGGAFGHRCYVEYYAILAFPLAGLFEHMWQMKSQLLRYGFFALVAFLLFFSVRLSYLYAPPWDGPDWRWNWEKYGDILRQLF